MDCSDQLHTEQCKHTHTQHLSVCFVVFTLGLSLRDKSNLLIFETFKVLHWRKHSVQNKLIVLRGAHETGRR